MTTRALWAMGVAILGLDAGVKALVSAFISPSVPWSVVQGLFGVDFALTHVTNRGAAWGLFAAWPGILLAVRMALTLGLIVYLFTSPKARPHRVPLTWIVAGALGNIGDVFFYGHVVDMFHFTLWGYSCHVFNIADMAISAGMIWMVGRSFFGTKPHVARRA